MDNSHAWRRCLLLRCSESSARASWAATMNLSSFSKRPWTPASLSVRGLTSAWSGRATPGDGSPGSLLGDRVGVVRSAHSGARRSGAMRSFRRQRDGANAGKEQIGPARWAEGTVRLMPMTSAWARALSRFMFGLGYLAGAPAWIGMERLAMAVSQRRFVRGVLVGVLNPWVDAEGIWSSTDRALGLIQQLDPRCCKRILHDVRAILVVPRDSDFTSMYTSTIVLAEKSVVGQNTVRAALALVHEAVHARLRRVGLKYWPDLQQRMEELCIREEIAFVGLLPLAGYTMPEDWLQPWEELLRTYPATKGGRFYRWLTRRSTALGTPT